MVTELAAATIPDATQVAILDAVIAEKFPKIALPSIASRFHLTLEQLRPIINRAGYPDVDRMRRAAEQARNRALAHRTEEPSTPAHEQDPGSELGRLLRVPLSRIQVEPHNLRRELTGIEELADSMASPTGLLEPITLRTIPHVDHFVVVAGHRRLAAARMLRWDAIPSIVRGGMMPAEVIAAMLIENGQRVGLDPIEEASGFAELKRLRLISDLQVAQLVGRSQAYVSARLALLDLSEEDQAAIRAGTMTLGLGVRRGRHKAGHYRPNARGKASAAHLSEHHPLARAVEALCRQQGHSKHTAGRIGGVGCGACWEAVIRSDEGSKLRRRSRQEADDL